MSTDDSSRTRKSTLPLHSLVAEARPRRSTLETFNEEMAVLERPLEGDVEYVDEPRPSRWRPIGFAAVVLIVGVGGALFMSRHRAGAEAQAKAAKETPAPVAAAAPSPILAAQAPAAAAIAPAEAPAPTEATAPAPTAPEADDAADGDAAASDDSTRRAPASKGAWAKVRSKAGHAKPARATSGKSTTTRRTTTTTTRHTVVAKRVTRHR